MLDAYLRRTYGITETEYNAMAEYQRDRCAICKGMNKTRGDGTRERLAVDHNHTTGENRALLCQRCNRVLGMIEDSQELAIRILVYLREHDGSAIPYKTPSELPVEVLSV